MYDWRFSKLYPQGGEAYWHSTTASADITSYGLLAGESALRVQHNDGKASGGALRCITQNFFFQKIFSPPAPPKPTGIRFRIYIPVAITLAQMDIYFNKNLVVVGGQKRYMTKANHMI